MAVSSYGASVVLQNNSGSAAASAAPTGSVFLFASGAAGSAKLYMNKEGSQDVLEMGADLKIAGDSGTGTVALNAGETLTIAGGTGLDTSVSGQTVTFAMDLNELSAAAVSVANDSIAIIDADDSNGSKKESIADLMTAVAGDGLAASSGVLAVGVDDSSIELSSDAVRVKASGVTNAMLAGSIADSKLQQLTTANKVSLAAVDIDGATALGGASVAQADLLVIDDGAGGTNKSVTFSNFEDSIFANISGDATVAAGGALTIAAGAVEGSMLADDCISAQGNLGGTGVADADEFMFSDGGTLKALTGANLYGWVFGKVSGDATIAAGGALTIAAQAVENSMLADDAVGADELAANAVVNASIASNAAIDMDKLDGGSLASSLSDLAQGDLMYAGDVDDSNNIKSITFSNLEDAIFGNVSGDATIAAGGALTIAAQAVENSMLADDAVGADELAADAVVNASVASNAAIVATKLNFNVDFGGNVQFGSQSDDVVAFGGPIKVGGNVIANSEGEATISMDVDQNVALAAAATVGGGYGATGITLSSAGNLQANGDATIDGAATFGGGYGSTGVTLSSAGNLSMDGRLVVGSDGAGSDFIVYGTAANEFLSYDASANLLKLNGSDGNTIVSIGGDATSEYAVDVANGSDNKNKVRAAAFVTYSDESLKSDVASMSNTALDTVMSLEGVEFTWKDSGERDFGFIAQDVQSVLPNAVHTAADGVQGVDYSRLTSVLVEAVKAQQVQIEELKTLLKK